MTRERRALALALGLALVPFLYLTWRFWFVCDDAYISFRYARHLASGLGLCFNVGVEPPVEGYSELLWVLLAAALEALGGAPPVVMPLLSAGAGAALVVLVVRYLARRIATEPAALAGAALVLGCLPPLAVWSTGGLATLPFLLCVWLVFGCLLSDRAAHAGAGAALAGTLVVLLRADGFLWTTLLAGFALALAVRRRDPCLRKAALLGLLVPLAVFGAHTLFRLEYHGDWLPNTARAKGALSAFVLARGARYVGHFFLTFPGVALALLAPLALGRRCLERPTVAAYVVVGATLAYALRVGGDFMCFGRFLLPALPFAVLVFAKFLQALAEDGRRALALAAAGLVAALNVAPAFGVHAVPQSVRETCFFRFNATDPTTGAIYWRDELEQWRDMQARAADWAVVGRALARNTEPGDSLVFGPMGAIGYYSELFLYDIFGLVTREVTREVPASARRSPGHDKNVAPEYFLPERPTYMWLEVLGADDPRLTQTPPPHLRVILLDDGRGVVLRRGPR
jgi:arabinofuranosyltransferase